MEPMAPYASEQPSPWERLALASGIVFVALQLAGLVYFFTFFVPKQPPVDAPAARFAAFYADSRPTITINNYLVVLTTPFLLLFVGGLFGILRRAEGGTAVLAAAVLGSGTASAVITALGWTISQLGTDIAARGGDPATIRALDAMSPLSLAVGAFPRAVLLGATSLVLLRSRLAPRWIGWLGLAVGVVGLIGTGTFVATALFPILALGSLLFELWTLALSVALLRRPWVARQPAPQVAAA